jgi:hypothetical protein
MSDYCASCPVRALGIPCAARSGAIARDGHRGHPLPLLCDRAAAAPEHWTKRIVDASTGGRSPQEAASPGEPPRPSMLARASSFVSAAVTHLIDHGREASAKTQAARRAICDACEFRRSSDDTCAKCGCGLGPASSFLGQHKLKWASSVCPEKKWSAEPANNAADMELKEALLRLSDEQRLEIATCPSRTRRSTDCCAGHIEVCGMGYFDGGAITALQCAKCRLAGWARDQSTETSQRS